MMQAYRAGRILTMDRGVGEIVDGGLLADGGRVVAVGPWREIAGQGVRHDLGAVTIVPGLVNAHAHLELSRLAGTIPAGLGFAAWADALFAALRSHPASLSGVARAAALARASGTCFVADVVGREADMVREALEGCGLGGHLFSEHSGRLRSREFRPAALPGSWSPAVHALYSTEPALAREVKDWCASRGLPFSLHLAEVPGENELFEHGGGEFADFLRARRILPRGFEPSGGSAVARARDLGLLDPGTLAVHCVQLSEEDIAILGQSGACVCLCPRSNAHIGVGLPPAARLREAGVPLCLGTDSLASNADLDLWAELRALRALLPEGTPLAELLAVVTRNPARFLGVDEDYGSLQPGRLAHWTVLPEDFADMK